MDSCAFFHKKQPKYRKNAKRDTKSGVAHNKNLFILCKIDFSELCNSAREILNSTDDN